MGEDKQKARRQRNIHLSGDCGNATVMSRDFVYVKSITFVCAVQKQKDKRPLGSQKETAMTSRMISERTENELNSNSRGNILASGRGNVLSLCVPHALRFVPCLLIRALCNVTRGPCYVHCVWRHPLCLHDVCLACRRLELIAW